MLWKLIMHACMQVEQNLTNCEMDQGQGLGGASSEPLRRAPVGLLFFALLGWFSFCQSWYYEAFGEYTVLAHHDYLITRPDIWFCFGQFNLLRNWYWMLTDFLFTGRSLYPKGKQERDGQWHNNHKTVSCLWLFQNEDNSVSLKYDLFLSVLRSQMHVILRLPKSS